MTNYNVPPSDAPQAAAQAALAGGVAIVLAAAVSLVYAAGLSSPFIFDDQNTIVNNGSITRLWPLVGTRESPGPLSPPRQLCTAGRPLVNLSLALNYRAGALEPRGYHLVNAIIHTLNALLLWAIVRRTLLLIYFAGAFTPGASWLALAVALVWAVHPLETEAVQYVTQRTELLVSFFYLATLLASLHYWAAGSGPARTAWLMTATLACLAGMASKEVMVTAPVLVLLYQYTFLTGSFRRALSESGPLYVCLGGSWLLLAALNLGGPRSASAGFHVGVPALAWWFTQAKVFFLYLQLVVWPWPLAIHYDIPYLETVDAAWPWLLVFVLLVSATIMLVRERTTEGFVAASVLLILSPTLVTPIATEIAAERRMYLPSAVLVAAVFGAAYELFRSLARGSRAEAFYLPTPRWAVVLATAVVVVVSSIAAAASASRVSVFRDVVSLWQDALTHQPANPKFHNNLGVALVAAGRNEEAIAHLQAAVQLRPEFAEARFNLAAEMRKAGRHPEAVAHYEAGLRVVPDYAQGHYEIGAELFALSRRDDAVAHLRDATRLAPDHVEAQYLLAQCLLDRGEFDEARQRVDVSLRLAPQFPAARRLLGDVLAAQNDLAAAETEYRAALALAPHDAWTLDSLGLLRWKQGQLSQAIELFSDAVRYDPGFPAAQDHLKRALAERDRPPELPAGGDTP